MNTGLIQLNAPATSPQPGGSAKANISPTSPGKSQSFARHLQAPAAGDRYSSPLRNLSQQSESGIKEGPASQGSASLRESLMDKLHASPPITMTQASEALTQEVSQLNRLTDLSQETPDVEALLEQCPSLALLTGRLEFIDANEIPAIVTSDKFIQSALAADGTSNFMNSPQRLGDLMAELNLPSALNEMVDKLGVDLAEEVTPRQLLTSLGIDPGIVNSELQMLKSNLQLDGLSSYMIRAEKLQVHKAQHQITEELSVVQIDEKYSTASSDELVPSAMTVVGFETDNFAQRNDLSKEAKLAVEPLAKDAERVSQLNQLPTEPSELNQHHVSSGRNGPFVGIDHVSHDPTQEIIRLFDQMSADQKYQFNFLNTKQPKTVGSLSEAISILPGDHSSINQLNVGESQGYIPPQSNQMHAMTIDRLIASQMQVHDVGNDFSSVMNFSGGSSDSSFDQTFSNESELSFGLERGIPVGMSNSSKAEFLDTLNQLNSTPSDTIQKQVIEKVQMLVKDGGGQIKLDIGSGDHKVELALDIQNDTVNLKILTASDQMKDLLASDLPKLREALGQQKLELNEVELGSQSRREWSNGSFDQGSFQRGFSEQRERLVEQPGTLVKSSSHSYKNIIADRSGYIRPQHSGHIQVFA